jgi:hypothetical protein
MGVPYHEGTATLAGEGRGEDGACETYVVRNLRVAWLGRTGFGTYVMKALILTCSPQEHHRTQQSRADETFS